MKKYRNQILLWIAGVIAIVGFSYVSLRYLSGTMQNQFEADGTKAVCETMLT